MLCVRHVCTLLHECEIRRLCGFSSLLPLSRGFQGLNSGWGLHCQVQVTWPAEIFHRRYVFIYIFYCEQYICVYTCSLHVCKCTHVWVESRGPHQVTVFHDRVSSLNLQLQRSTCFHPTSARVSGVCTMPGLWVTGSELRFSGLHTSTYQLSHLPNPPALKEELICIIFFVTANESIIILKFKNTQKSTLYL